MVKNLLEMMADINPQVQRKQSQSMGWMLKTEVKIKAECQLGWQLKLHWRSRQKGNLHSSISSSPRASTEISWKRLAWGERWERALPPWQHLKWNKSLQLGGENQENLPHLGPRERACLKGKSRAKAMVLLGDGAEPTCPPATHTPAFPPVTITTV